MFRAASCVVVKGPLGPFADGFRSELVRLGYAPCSTVQHLELAGDVSRWLDLWDLGPEDLTVQRVEQFLRARRAEGWQQFLSARALSPLLGYLRSLGVTPPAMERPARTASGRLVEDYRRYLVGERGLAAGTVERYVHIARLFLRSRPVAAAGVAGIDAAVVRGFVLAQCSRRKVGSAKNLVSALRVLLRFLHVRGLAADVVGAVPSVAGWRLASLPRGLNAGHVKLLLASCDRRRSLGRRDRAILVLLARMGLRAGEVAALQLDDIDWRHGEVVVRGKGAREERLPLPADVGEAIAAYLRRGRPESTRREVFLQARAPRGGLSPGGVSGVVGAACDRAGLPRVGAHRLRHSAATAMLGAGAPLAEIAQVLRHHNEATTAIYAKVDLASLSLVAMPWPGVGR